MTASRPQRVPGLRGSLVAFLGVTALVTVGAITLFVFLDPRTLPWLAGQLAAAWSALVTYVSSLRPR